MDTVDERVAGIAVEFSMWTTDAHKPALIAVDVP